MKNKLTKTLILCCVSFFLINVSLNSQRSRTGNNSSQFPSISGEKIKLFTDRNIYSVDEKICFTAEYYCIDELSSLPWSDVLYVELIRWNGNKLARMKLKLTGKGTSGALDIPSTLLSGNYYLRAYTKWMRNFSALEYTYLPVKIVNPLRSEIDEGPAGIAASSVSDILKSEEKAMTSNVIISTDKNEYVSREKAEFRLSLNNSELPDSERFCVSVVKDGTTDTTIWSYEPGSSLPKSNLTYIEYLPEIRGITISGEIMDKSNTLPVKNALVSLSETRNGEHYAVYKTNDRGRFVFSLPDFKGQYDFFIQTESPSDILIDDGYCSKPVTLPYIAFSLSNDETEVVKEMVINHQLGQRFLPDKDTPGGSGVVKKEPIVFYGNKKVVYPTLKYIELPDIGEFIAEIVLEAVVIREKGKASFISMRREDFSNHLPLILLDNIQVKNDEQLLKIPLERIERVEVINQDYEVGGIKYDGIISIYSRNKDFAGFDLNKNSTFFTYDTFSETETGPETVNTPTDARIPDRRNLLYWNPDIQLSAERKTTISFYTSDVKGRYILFIRRKNSPDGHETYSKFYFVVR